MHVYISPLTTAQCTISHTRTSPYVIHTGCVAYDDLNMHIHMHSDNVVNPRQTRRYQLQTNHTAVHDMYTPGAQEIPTPTHDVAAVVLRKRHLAAKQKRTLAVAGFASFFRTPLMPLLM